MNSVGRAAQSVVLEVRRQFREIAGLMEGKADPDYARCVDLCTKASLKEMVLPTVIAVVTPIVVGMVLGYKGVVGLLAGATVTGFLMAIYMANAGGAGQCQEVHRGGQLRRQGRRLPQGRRGGRHRGRPLQGHLRPRHQHSHQAAEHGVHCVRWPDRELFHLLRSLGLCQAIENAEAPSRKAGRSGLLYCVKAVSLRRR